MTNPYKSPSEPTGGESSGDYEPFYFDRTRDFAWRAVKWTAVLVLIFCLVLASIDVVNGILRGTLSIGIFVYALLAPLLPIIMLAPVSALIGALIGLVIDVRAHRVANQRRKEGGSGDSGGFGEAVGGD